MGLAPSIDRSKLERDIVDFRQMRFDKFGVSKERMHQLVMVKTFTWRFVN